jgi:hypothetical protein
MDEHICATINTAEQVLTLWHTRDAESDWRLLKTRSFRLKETVQPLLLPSGEIVHDVVIIES